MSLLKYGYLHDINNIFPFSSSSNPYGVDTQKLSQCDGSSEQLYISNVNLMDKKIYTTLHQEHNSAAIFIHLHNY